MGTQWVSISCRKRLPAAVDQHRFETGCCVERGCAARGAQRIRRGEWAEAAWRGARGEQVDAPAVSSVGIWRGRVACQAPVAELGVDA